MFEWVDATLLKILFVKYFIKSIDLLDFKSYFRYYRAI